MCNKNDVKNYNTRVLLRKWIIDEGGSEILRMDESMKSGIYQILNYNKNNGIIID